MGSIVLFIKYKNLISFKIIDISCSRLCCFLFENIINESYKLYDSLIMRPVILNFFMCNTVLVHALEELIKMYVINK